MKIALVTCQEIPEPDVDKQITLEAFQSAGHDAEWLAWDDPSVVWSDYDLAILRSPWNYIEEIDAFQSWLELASEQTKVLNPKEVVLKNLHKSYLLELQKNGIPIVPTILCSKELKTLPEILWDRFVLKPAISAGSYRTKVFQAGNLGEIQEFAELIWQDADLLIQEYMPSVENFGETSWIFIGGEITHAVKKKIRLLDDEECVSNAILPTKSDLERLQIFRDQIPLGCLYGRIDVMEHEDKWLLSELELIEPSLFLLQFPEAADKFVACAENSI